MIRRRKKMKKHSRNKKQLQTRKQHIEFQLLKGKMPD